MIANFTARLGATSYVGSLSLRSPILRTAARRLRGRHVQPSVAAPSQSPVVADEGDRFHVDFLVPGYSVEQLTLVADGSELRVKADARTAATTADPSPLDLVVRFPRAIDADRVAARLMDGVLSVTAPTLTGTRVEIRRAPSGSPKDAPQ